MLRRRGEVLQRTEALSRSNEELQGFAYAVSHDLREPLRNIGAFTDLLLRRNEKTLDKDSKEYAEMIVGGVRRMESMIKGLLDYAAVNNDLHNRAASADSRVVLQQLLVNLQHLIEAEGAVITFDKLPLVQAHEDRLAQVLSNLITNGIKYHGDRKPQVHISATDNGTEWIFKIADNGIGIDMRYADEIFGLFRRLHSSDSYEGSGIGLALCKAIVERRGGRIWVESEPGQGSTFLFTIPKITAERSSTCGPPVTIIKSRTVGAR